SSLVSQLTRDDSVSTKSRENRWKLGGNTSNSIVKAKNTSAIFPLQIRSFVIAKFDNTFCVAQIIAMYERDTSMHSYIDTPISDLKSLSYISLKIFFHVN
ncbi:6313_t:CDS:2, partial [Gigaspora rosea]